MSMPRRGDGRALWDALSQLEPTADQLRRDPCGHGWIPAPLRARIDAHDNSEAIVRTYVETEMQLIDVAREQRSDPLFTARVMDALPEDGGPVMDRGRRRTILAVAYSVAAVAAFVVVSPSLSSASLSWLDPTHGWAQAVQAGGFARVGAGGAVVIALALPFTGGRRVRSSA